MKKFFETNIVTLIVAIIAALGIILLGACLILSYDRSTIQEQEWKISHLENVIAEQHYKIVSLDTEQLVLDIIYIDSKTGTDYLCRFLGRPQEEVSPKDTKPESRFPNNIKCTQEEFCELVEIFRGDPVKMELGVALVKECYKNEAYRLNIMDQRIKEDIKSALQSNSRDKKLSSEKSINSSPKTKNSPEKEPEKAKG